MIFLFSEYYFPGSIALLFFLVLTIVRHVRSKSEQNELDVYQDDVRKSELQNLLENREDREILEPYSEEEFWALIDKVTERAKPGYTFQLGVLRDRLSQMSPDDLVRVDNLYQKLIFENISHDLTAAAAIIFKRGDLPTAVLLMNLFIMQGEVFFKNACQNPTLLIGKQIANLEARGLDDIISDLYLRKTGKLIPLSPEPEEPLVLSGEPWKERELPSKYAELWQTFA